MVLFKPFEQRLAVILFGKKGIIGLRKEYRTT